MGESFLFCVYLLTRWLDVSLYGAITFILFGGGFLLGYIWKKRYGSILQLVVKNKESSFVSQGRGIKVCLVKDDINFIEEIRYVLLPDIWSRFQSTETYLWLRQLEKQEKETNINRFRRHELQQSLSLTFKEILVLLKQNCSRLTSNDQLYCLLVLIGCSTPTILEVTGATYEAIKTRKSRLKTKLPPSLFETLFMDNSHHKTGLFLLSESHALS